MRVLQQLKQKTPCILYGTGSLLSKIVIHWNVEFQGHIIYVYRSGRAQIVALKGRRKGGTPLGHT